MRGVLVLLCLLVFGVAVAGEDFCRGKFMNPVTDVCWSCLFPISIGSVNVVKGDLPDIDNPTLPVCLCKNPNLRIGITLGFWEPIRLVDVTRHPFCMVSMGGKVVNLKDEVGVGTVNQHSDENNTSFYHVHWYVSPILYWFNLLVDAGCVEATSFDIAYLSEFDPSWNDDELALLLNPEATLFANQLSQKACANDCRAANKNLPKDKLHWCAGCQGSMYPLSGHVQAHVGGVQASTLLTERMVAKFHRMGILRGTSGKEALCQPYRMRTIQKSQYRYQMTFPVPATTQPDGCKPFGHETAKWGTDREFPVDGEDFAYLVWRKRNCCAF